MVRMHCDGCGTELRKGDLRYTVKIDVRAAYDQLEIGLAELFRDHREELRALVARLEGEDPQKLEETIYKVFQLDLCPQCQRAYLRNPLRFRPDQRGPEPPVDIDAFLRSLGFGGGAAHEE